MQGSSDQLWRNGLLARCLNRGFEILKRIASSLAGHAKWRYFLRKFTVKGGVRRFGSARYALAVAGLLIGTAASITMLDTERPLITRGLADQTEPSLTKGPGPAEGAERKTDLGDEAMLSGSTPVATGWVAEARRGDEQAPSSPAESPAAGGPTRPQATPEAVLPEPKDSHDANAAGGDGESFVWIDLLAKEADEELGDATKASSADSIPQIAKAPARFENTAEAYSSSSSQDALSGDTTVAVRPLSDGPSETDPSPSEQDQAKPWPLHKSSQPEQIDKNMTETPDQPRNRSSLMAERIIDLPDLPSDSLLPPDVTPGRDAEQPVAIPDPPMNPLLLHAGKGRLVRLGQLIDKVLLADPAIADVQVISPRLIYVFGSQVGSTDLFALAGNGDIVASLDLNVIPDTERAEEILAERYPESGVNLDALDGKIVARGEVQGFEEAYDAAALAQQLAPASIAPSNQTTIARSQQINLRVRFAEIRRNDIYRLGINWQALIERGDFLIGLATGNFAVAGSAVSNEIFGTAFGSFDSGSVDLDVVIDALQREGVVSILAEPNLTAMNGEPASFLAGGEFPFPVPSGDGDVTIQFKEFGVSLNFLPTLLGDDRIAIQVRPEVSQINFGSGFAIDGFVVPLLTVRRTQTTVELNSGQTFALAGLFQRNVSDDLDKFPFLGDIPILGKLFQSVRYQQEETELVILITPYLVKPVAEQNLVLPGDSPYRASLPRRKPPRRTVEDMTGFIID